LQNATAPLQQSFPVARAKRGRGKARAFTDNRYRESGLHQAQKAFDFIKNVLFLTQKAGETFIHNFAGTLLN